MSGTKERSMVTYAGRSVVVLAIYDIDDCEPNRSTPLEALRMSPDEADAFAEEIRSAAAVVRAGGTAGRA